jgi:hypothetical protein
LDQGAVGGVVGEPAGAAKEGDPPVGIFVHIAVGRCDRGEAAQPQQWGQALLQAPNTRSMRLRAFGL